MSEQDKKSGGSGGSVVMVDVSASSRHKPYRPTELQDEAPPELHKRSKAPAVPSLAEELKNINESDTTATRERTESQSSEKQTNVSKNISSTGKRRGSEEIAMVSLDTKKLASLPSPIPAKVETVVSEVSSIEGEEKADRDKKGDDDSITEEIKELRTADPTTKEHSEWPTHSAMAKKKEISWKLQEMKAKSQAAILDRKPSVGPCFKASAPHIRPSGITICVPKKSVRIMKEEFKPVQSVINFNVPKKMVTNSTCYVDQSKMNKKLEPGIKICLEEQPNKNLFNLCRMKLDNMTCKIRNVLNM